MATQSTPMNMDVPALINRFGGTRGITPPGLRHGAAERGRLRPTRSRERYSSAPRAAVIDRAVPVGPQETIDWSEALERVTDRIETIERTLRLQGQTMAVIDEKCTRLHELSVDANTDIVEYKGYVEGVFKN